MSFLASASWGGWVAQAAAFLLPRTVHSSSNFLSSCFLHTFSTFRIFRFLRVIASISLVSWRREPFASKRAVNKQKSQAEILENCQALPFCFWVSKRQRMRRCELERALQGYSIGYSAGSHEYTLKVDILAQGPWRREWNAFDAVQEGSGEGGRAPVPRGASSAEADSNDAYAGASACPRTPALFATATA